MMNAIRALITLLLALLTLPIFASLEMAPYQMPRTHVVKIEDVKSNRQYELYIKLPDNYDESADIAYPVIYTTDAKWQMDLLSGVTEYLMSKVILVGVSWQTNMSSEIDFGARREFASRFRDYSFIESDKPDVQATYQFGQAAQHLSFIRNHVIHYVNTHYRIAEELQTYLGYSMGAEFGAYILLSQPDTFDNYILGSPSVDDRSIRFLDDLANQNRAKHDAFNNHVFVSIGERETPAMDATQRLVSILKAKTTSGLSLTGLEVIDNADHTTAVPDTFVLGIKWLATRYNQ
ncbi:alpha/beta hydrolase [Alteromonas facilis]|uniref:alpha/beta hydrolase n=1 Tax=Alteromonas facilis TaxID=2048004 RepID=UPI000C282C2B|nr:alpha/beta hydrolase-fold protein [Alteromonas facilis]